MARNIGDFLVTLKVDQSKVGSGLGGLLSKSKEVDQLDASMIRLNKSLRTLDKVAVAAGAALGVALFKSLAAARDLTEVQNKAARVFEGSFSQVEEFADDAAQALGQSEEQVLRFTSTFGNLLTTFGVTNSAAAEMSITLTQVATDLASFNDVPIDEVLTKLRGGLTGEGEQLKTLGINVNQVTLANKAFEEGLTSVRTSALTPLQKSLAAYAIILEDAENAAGDFALTSEDLANKQRTSLAIFQDIQAAAGKALEPVAVEFLNAFEENAPGIERFGIALAEVTGELFSSGLPVLEGTVAVLEGLASVLESIPDGFLTIAAGVLTLTRGSVLLGKSVQTALRLGAAVASVGTASVKAGSKVSLLRVGVSRVAGALGPLGVAAGVGAGLFLDWQQRVDEAQKVANDWAAQLPELAAELGNFQQAINEIEIFEGDFFKERLEVEPGALGLGDDLNRDLIEVAAQAGITQDALKLLVEEAARPGQGQGGAIRELKEILVDTGQVERDGGLLGFQFSTGFLNAVNGVLGGGAFELDGETFVGDTNLLQFTEQLSNAATEFKENFDLEEPARRLAEFKELISGINVPISGLEAQWQSFSGSLGASERQVKAFFRAFEQGIDGGQLSTAEAVENIRLNIAKLSGGDFFEDGTTDNTTFDIDVDSPEAQKVAIENRRKLRDQFGDLRELYTSVRQDTSLTLLDQNNLLREEFSGGLAAIFEDANVTEVADFSFIQDQAQLIFGDDFELFSPEQLTGLAQGSLTQADFEAIINATFSEVDPGKFVPDAFRDLDFSAIIENIRGGGDLANIPDQLVGPLTSDQAIQLRTELLLSPQDIPAELQAILLDRQGRDDITETFRVLVDVEGEEKLAEINSFVDSGLFDVAELTGQGDGTFAYEIKADYNGEPIDGEQLVLIDRLTKLPIDARNADFNEKQTLALEVNVTDEDVTKLEMVPSLVDEVYRSFNQEFLGGPPNFRPEVPSLEELSLMETSSSAVERFYESTPSEIEKELTLDFDAPQPIEIDNVTDAGLRFQDLESETITYNLGVDVNTSALSALERQIARIEGQTGVDIAIPPGQAKGNLFLDGARVVTIGEAGDEAAVPISDRAAGINILRSDPRLLTLAAEALGLEAAGASAPSGGGSTRGQTSGSRDVNVEVTNIISGMTPDEMMAFQEEQLRAIAEGLPIPA